MKPKSSSSIFSLFNDQISNGTATLRLLLVFSATLTGCATDAHKDFGSVVRAGPTLTDGARANLGIVGVVTPTVPASCVIEKPKGQIDYPGDRAGSVAHDVLSFQPIGQPQLDAVVAVADAAVAPFAASGAALKAKNRKLSTDALSDREQRVSQALTEAADQAKLRDRVMQVAAETGRRQLVQVDRYRLAQRHVDTVLEPRIEEIRLERTGSSDASFALRMKTRVRITDAATSKVIYDEPFEYVSGTALFLDWSMEDVLAKVAETARNQLVANMVGHLFSTPLEGPLLLGAGYQQPPRKDGMELASLRNANRGRKANETGDARILPADFRPSASDSAGLIRADYRFVNSGAIGIYSTSTLAHITVQRPLTKDEAVIEALEDLKYGFDDLDEFPNIVVQLGVCAAAIPISLYKQTAAAVHGIGARKLARADAALSTALQETRPHEEVARQVAQCLAPQTAQPVKLVRRAWPAGEPEQYANMQCVARGTLTGLSPSQSANDYLMEQGADNAMEIEITRAALEGKEGINAPLALAVEARVLLFRSRDGRPIYSEPVNYRSAQHKFTEWADHDARLFRAEIARCYDEMGGAIADELVARHIVPARARRVNEIAGQ